MKTRVWQRARGLAWASGWGVGVLLVALAALSMAAAPEGRGTAASREDPAVERELLTLRRQVEFQNKELAAVRQRLGELRRAVAQSVGTLKSRAKEGQSDAVVSALERALAATSPAGSAVAAMDERAGAGGMGLAPAATPTAAAMGAAPGAGAGAGGAAPAAAQPVMPATFHVGAYQFSKIVFAPAEAGAACTGRITNQNTSTRDEVVTPGFVLTTLDEKGQEIQKATFYVAFSEIDQTKAFTVPLTRVPPTGRFKIEPVVE